MGTAQAEGTNWVGVILSALMPLAIAAGFVVLAQQPDWEPSEIWIYGMLALAPLDFVRALILSLLGDAYKKNSSPQAAIKDFLTSVAIMGVLFLVLAICNAGPFATFATLADPLFYKIAALPVLVMLLDCVFGILTFRGDRMRQAERLLAVSEDLAEWMMFSAFRMPFLLLVLIGLLALGKQDGWGWVQSLPDVDGRFMRQSGLFYLAWYFFIKALCAAYVHTARFEQSGLGLLQARWVQWIFSIGSKQEDTEAPSRRSVEVPRPEPKSALAFEEKVIRQVQARRDGAVHDGSR